MNPIKPSHCLLRTLTFLAFITLTGTNVADMKFEEVAKTAKVEFRHQSGAEGRRWTVEITGAGVGLLDYDNDGLLDIWAIQGGPLKDRTDSLPSDRLFKNVTEGGVLQFKDVTLDVGIQATHYGMGIVTGDIDNDGDIDVVLLNFKQNQLFLNEGGKFVEQTDSPIAQGANWSISGSLADLNGDGYLDLYVGNYMEFPEIRKYKACRRMSMRRGYCAPSNFEPTPDQLFINDGTGKFSEVSLASGIQESSERAMGVVIDDFDRDNLPDIFVANDMAMNFLWLNRGGMKFEDKALPSGVAVNGHGMREASMGVAVGDWDRDFDPDLFLTHDIKESNTLYNSEFKGWFADETMNAGLASTSLSKTGFGTVFFDAENDGDLDLFIANGSVSMLDDQLAKKIEPPLRQKNQLYLNKAGDEFIEATHTSLSRDEEVSRGVAVGDLDNDGDPDLVVSNNEGPLQIFENLSTNQEDQRNHWLGVRVMQGSAEAIGAVVWLEGENKERKVVRTDGSYASASDPRLLFGLGMHGSLPTVNVQWRDGTIESFKNLAIDKYHQLKKSNH